MRTGRTGPARGPIIDRRRCRARRRGFWVRRDHGNPAPIAPYSPALTIALALFASIVLVAQAAAAPPRPGAPGLGDRLFPTLGNGGYDAGHYHLDLTYPTAEPEQTVDGEVTMIARATQSLSSFNLDFAGDSVESVRVNGASRGLGALTATSS